MKQKPPSDRKRITIWICDTSEEAFHRRMAEQYEAECRAHDLEQCIGEDMTLHDREPLFFEMREETDPYWPPRELDIDEVVEPEVFEL